MKLIVTLCITLLFNSLIAQEKYHAGITGIATPFLNTELQLEVLIKNNLSLGLRMRNENRGRDIKTSNTGSVVSSEPLFIPFRGTKFEPFIRWYPKSNKRGNVDGLFAQAKFGYGDFSNPLFRNSEEKYTNRRWNTYGGGLGIGYKATFGKHFIFDMYGGLLYYKAPVFSPSSTYDTYSSTNWESYERLAIKTWYLTQACPLEFNFRVGFQF